MSEIQAIAEYVAERLILKGFKPLISTATGVGSLNYGFGEGCYITLENGARRSTVFLINSTGVFYIEIGKQTKIDMSDNNGIGDAISKWRKRIDQTNKSKKIKW